MESVKDHKTWLIEEKKKMEQEKIKKEKIEK
jgi:hypothetical protein